MPFNKIQLLLSDLFGSAINELTGYSASKQCYDQLKTTEEVIKSKVSKAYVLILNKTLNKTQKVCAMKNKTIIKHNELSTLNKYLCGVSNDDHYISNNLFESSNNLF